MNWTFVSAVVLLFVAVVLGVESAYEWWRNKHGAAAKRLAKRLDALSGGGIDMRSDAMSILKARKLSETRWLNALLEQLPNSRSLDQYLLRSGLRWTVGRFVVLSVGVALIALIVLGLLRFPLLAALPVAAGCFFLPLLFAQRAYLKRMRTFEVQLPEACDMLSRALRSGHAFTAAIQMVGNEFQDPIGTEFRLAFGEINYGVPINHALTNLAKRVPIRDLRYFVIAVLIQRETGGNLAELLDGITTLIRERFKLHDRVRVLSAEGKMSVWILTLLPVGLAVLIYLLNPGFLSVLWTDPLGWALLGLAAGLLVIGIFWSIQTVKIRI